MSFFNDFLNNFKIDDISSKPIISLILGEGMMVVGKIKIINFSDANISLLCCGETINIDGKMLYIKSISKGELLISGQILNIAIQEVKHEK